MIKEIRIHGRGGQGVVTAAELLANAAYEDGKFVQAFPSFGSERMGSPLQAFVRISDRGIRTRSQVYEPDYVMVQDPTLIGVTDVLKGLKGNGLAIINIEKKPEELNLKTNAKIITIPALKIALEATGRPIVNTTLIGAFAGATNEISLDSVIKSIKSRFPEEIAKKNIIAVERAYHITANP